MTLRELFDRTQELGDEFGWDRPVHEGVYWDQPLRHFYFDQEQGIYYVY
ncbi:hypothetical protein [Mycobacteroides abscessus]|nr:hypothetical protein [Mycobacteroides abscessus]